MKAALLIFALASFAAVAVSECPNACSGHGECGTNDNCVCDPNWMANDCSQRVCPFGLAWVDTPVGDLNHNGYIDMNANVPVRWSNSELRETIPAPSNNDEGHFYMECSNRGLCDRDAGECICFEGYTGSSCQRTACPNDCSGNGICRTVAEVATGALNKRLTGQSMGKDFYSGVTETFDYSLWDADKAQTCVCDPGFTGPDCSLRECPRGDDPLTHRAKDCGGAACADAVQTFTVSDIDGSATSEDIDIKLQFRFSDNYEQTWESAVVTVTAVVQDTASLDAATTASNNEAAAVIERALHAMPNGVLLKTKVSAVNSADDVVTFRVSFVSGTPSLLEVRATTVDSQTATTAPQLQSAAITLNTYTQLTASTAGNTENVVCSNRGLCDYETGLCKCFKGYYDDDCSTQNALAM